MIKKSEISNFRTITHRADFCVAGGGMAGILAAVSAARKNLKVVLMQDRSVLGGNASSEVRMRIGGAQGKNMHETGILEELALENTYINPEMNYSVWDSVLLHLVKNEKNITLLLNCSCLDAAMKGDTIESIKGWQTTTQTYHRVYARVFADCSGDSVLAPLTGALWRMGREGSDEFGESIAPCESDNKTMGLSCLIEARETPRPVRFICPSWAKKFTKDDFDNRLDLNDPSSWEFTNFWWIELGGLCNTIDDTENLTDELIKSAYGVWDFVKNSGYFNADNYELEWIGTLAGKRESRRYEGLHILTQGDVENEGPFSDNIAYGGWTMDDHHPAGMLTREEPTVYNPAPSPYGIPLRCLISKNIKNLTFAGRNISATHSALSSTRVMATCGIMGQALGTAVAVALKNGIMPRDLNGIQIKEIQQQLLRDDCYIPRIKKEHSPVFSAADIRAEGDASKLKDGFCRKTGETDHCYTGRPGSPVIFSFKENTYIKNIRLILDSDLDRETQSSRLIHGEKNYPMRFHISLDMPLLNVPSTLIKDIDIYSENKKVCEIRNNYQRLLVIPLNIETRELKLIPLETHGTEEIRIYDIDFD